MPKRKRWGGPVQLAKELDISYQRIHYFFTRHPYDGKKNKQGKLDLDYAKEFYERNVRQVQRQAKVAKRRLLKNDTRENDKNRGVGKSTESERHHRNDASADSGEPTYMQSQAKKEAAMARIKELEVLQKEGKLVELIQAKKLFTQLGQQLKSQLEEMNELFISQLESKGILFKKEHRKYLHELLRSRHAEILQSFQSFKILP